MTSAAFIREQATPEHLARRARYEHGERPR